MKQFRKVSLQTTFFTIILLSLFVNEGVHAQLASPFSSGSILHNMNKLKHTARVMYVAAHPDDENTALISYFENKRYFQTAYLSLTRGDGGQNVIGPELREGLGLIRTQELLAARKIDGGQQFFTRANDFGYSKNPTETLNKWDKEKVLADMVWAIRKFQPDIIITRFNKTPGITHGHHTTSAILAEEAFYLSGDKDAYPEQLQFVDVWSPKHIFWNTSTWFYGNDFPEEKFIKVNVGGFNPYLGASYPEIAAKSRSQHKSQAFGTSGRRGDRFEYFEHWNSGASINNLFSGVGIKWAETYEGGKKIDELISVLIESFDAENPAASIPTLIEIRKVIDNLSTRDVTTEQAQEVVNSLIRQCLGLYLDASTSSPFASPGDSISFNLELTNRSKETVTLQSVQIRDRKISIDKKLQYRDKFESSLPFKISVEEPISNPYWLVEKHDDAMYTVNDQQLIGLPENGQQFFAKYTVVINDEEFDFIIPIVYRTSDRVKGEYTEPFYIIPQASIVSSDAILLFKDNQTVKKLTFEVKAFSPVRNASLAIETPVNISVEPSVIKDINLSAGETGTFTVEVSSQAEEGRYELLPKLKSNELISSSEIGVISYDHIPKQIIVEESKVKIVQTSIERKGDLIGYIEGAGDIIPEALETIGYEVELINIAESTIQDLKRYDAIVAGIRAYNTNIDLQQNFKKLNEYVARGGTYVVQYNTTYSLPKTDFWPVQLSLSRNRITDEEAELQFIEPEHPLLNRPNKLTTKDFDNWVQERGLYFPNYWSDQYQPLLKGSDKGEESLEGALLYLPYEEGIFIYTGLSLFRELPAGVAGAYRLLANLVSARSDKDEN